MLTLDDSFGQPTFTQLDYVALMRKWNDPVYPLEVGHHMEWLDENGSHNIYETPTVWPARRDCTNVVIKEVMNQITPYLTLLGTIRWDKKPIDEVILSADDCGGLFQCVVVKIEKLLVEKGYKTRQVIRMGYKGPATIVSLA